MDSSLKFFLQLLEKVEKAQKEAMDENEKKCHICQLTFEEFKKLDKLGCPACYGAFRQQLFALLKEIHGSNKYEGKVPFGGDGKYGDVLLKREIEKNRQALNMAVAAEEFEEAARIRDLIVELEGK